MTAVWCNPEFLRNVRAQLRPAKVVATACICAALSIVIGYASSHQNERQPLVMGALFLIIFYTCAMILMASLGILTRPEQTAFSAFFIPSGAFELDHSKWILRPAIWGAAFVAQWLLTAFFIGLQKKTIDELNSPATTPAATPVPAQT